MLSCPPELLFLSDVVGQLVHTPQVELSVAKTHLVVVDLWLDQKSQLVELFVMRWEIELFWRCFDPLSVENWEADELGNILKIADLFSSVLDWF